MTRNPSKRRAARSPSPPRLRGCGALQGPRCDGAGLRAVQPGYYAKVTMHFDDGEDLDNMSSWTLADSSANCYALHKHLDAFDISGRLSSHRPHRSRYGPVTLQSRLRPARSSAHPSAKLPLSKLSGDSEGWTSIRIKKILTHFFGDVPRAREFSARIGNRKRQKSSAR